MTETNTPPLLFERLGITEAALREFCEKWRIRELALFGSVLRDDFRPDSDIDVLVSFGVEPTFALFLDTQEALQRLLGRPVDLLTRSSIERHENYLRRRAILGTAQVIYAE